MQKMINFDDITKENIREHNPNWPETSDHPYRMLIVGGSESVKTNSLFNLIVLNNTYNAKHIYAVMPMYNFIEYSDNYAKTLWQY